MNNNINIPDWDKEELWDAIEQELHPTDKDNRPMVWWWFGGLIVFAIFVWSLRPSNEEVLPETTQQVDEANSAFHVSESIQPIAKSIDVTPQVNTESKALTTIPSKKTRQTTTDATTQQRVNTTEHINQSPTSKAHYTSYQHSTTVNQLNAQITNGSIDSISPQLIEHLAILPSSVSMLNNSYPVLKFRHVIQLQQATPTIAKYNVSVDYAIGYSQQRLSGTDQVYIDAKKASESSAESQLLNIVLQRNLNQWQIGAGIALERSTEIARLNDKRLIRTYTEPSDSTYIHTSNNNTVYLSGERQVRDYELRTIKSPNRYYAVYVPLSVGYAFEQIPLKLSASYYWNVWSTHTGYYIDTDLSIIDKSDNDDIKRIHTNKVSRLGLSASIAIIRRENQSLYLRGQYLRDLQSHNLHIGEKYDTYLVGVGWRFGF